MLCIRCIDDGFALVVHSKRQRSTWVVEGFGAHGGGSHAVEEGQHPVPGQLIGRVVQDAQEREEIFDVTGLEVLETAVLDERDVSPGELEFESGRVMTGTKEHCLVAQIDTAFSGLFVASIGLLVFSRTPADMLWIGVASMFVFGFMNSIANSSFFSVLQALIPHDMQGRVFTLIMSTSVAVSPIGLAIAGPVVELTGLRFWFVISGVVFMLGSFVGFTVPLVRTLEEDWERQLAEKEASE